MKKKLKFVIFGVELVVLIAVVMILKNVVHLTSATEGVTKVEIPEEEVQIQEEVKESVEMKGYRNIALFGLDSTVGELTKNTRSDTMIIASVNQDTGEVKLLSVYRDTYLNLGDDTYSKCNAAYARGGPQQAISMLNANFDLDITDFVAIGFEGLKEVIDVLGGIYIEIDEQEIQYVNGYQLSMAVDMEIGYTEITEAGYQLVDGLQAVAYCRIRATAGSDFTRTARQREVLMAIMDAAQQTDLATLTKAINVGAQYIATSVDVEDMIELAGQISEYYITDEGGVPTADQRVFADLSCGDSIVTTDLTVTASYVHELLFGQTDYEVSENLQAISDTIAENTAPYIRE
ncbi:MAG: LCP family protein [Lachnospiraceae bacterium]|nr:LCP family protein [Lachnospiraceae bacterium]